MIFNLIFRCLVLDFISVLRFVNTILSPIAGSRELPVRRRTDASRIFQSSDGRQRLWTVLEEVHLQDHSPPGRQRARVLQESQLLRFARVTVVESLNNTPPCLLSSLKIHVQLDRSGLPNSGYCASVWKRSPGPPGRTTGGWYLPSIMTFHISGALWTIRILPPGILWTSIHETIGGAGIWY